MLTRVLDLVREKNWFDTTSPFEKTIYLTHGSAHCVVLSRGGMPDAFVKFSEITSLAGEAARSERSSQDFPGMAPRFVGFAVAPPLELLVTEAVDYRPVTTGLTARRSDRVLLQAGFVRYFGQMRIAATQAAAQGETGAWLDDMHAYYDSERRSPAVAKGLTLLRAVRPALPPMAQHGDLVVNNIGLRPDGALVIFDWEDYGAVDLPGLDLFTLEMSLGHDAQGRAERQPDPVLAIDRCCAAMGLDVRAYKDLALAYAVTFRYLKRNYSAEVRGRADALITGVGGRRAA